jgi:predicted nucleotidyltransferase
MSPTRALAGATKATLTDYVPPITDDPDRRAIAFVDKVAAACVAALGDDVVAVILHGSLTLGEFAMERSDIDVLVVVERPVSDADVTALAEAVGRPPTRVDLRLVTRAVAVSPTPAPPMEAYIALRPGRAPAIETRVAEEPDLAVELSVVRAHGRRLIGAEPSAVIGEVPDEWIVEIGDRYLANWERLVDDAANAELMVLTACRIWRFAAEGVHCSKPAAGRWALARDPSLTAVAEALERRAIDEAGIARLLARVRREIATRRSRATR